MPLRNHLAAPVAPLAAIALGAALVAAALRVAWDPPARTYFEYVPIGTVLGSLIWDRLFPRWSGDVRATACDALVVGLAAMRAVVPPLPFVSGHALLSVYALVTAHRWPLRLIALVALAEVVYTKVFEAGGAGSFVAGSVLAGLLAAWRRRMATSN